jgi:hypothetical protein
MQSGSISRAPRRSLAPSAVRRAAAPRSSVALRLTRNLFCKSNPTKLNPTTPDPTRNKTHVALRLTRNLPYSARYEQARLPMQLASRATRM